MNAPPIPKPECRLKTILVAFLLALTHAACKPTPANSTPVTFEVRLVRDGAAEDTQKMTLAHKPSIPGQSSDELLYVQKTSLLDRTDLRLAEVQTDVITGAPEIKITFTGRGATRLAQVTRQNIGKRLAIVIDGRVISAPEIRSQIPGGKLVFSGRLTKEEAADLANSLKL